MYSDIPGRVPEGHSVGLWFRIIDNCGKSLGGAKMLLIVVSNPYALVQTMLKYYSLKLSLEKTEEWKTPLVTIVTS